VNEHFNKLANGFVDELAKLGAKLGAKHIQIDAGIPGGLYFGQRVGTDVAMKSAYKTAPRGSKNKAAKTSRIVAFPTIMTGSLAAMLAGRKSRFGRKLHTALRRKTKLNSAEAKVLMRTVYPVSLGTAGGAAAGLATGSAVGGVARAKHRYQRWREARVKTAAFKPIGYAVGEPKEASKRKVYPIHADSQQVPVAAKKIYNTVGPGSLKFGPKPNNVSGADSRNPRVPKPLPKYPAV
jgi:hypothetical protein